MSFFLIRPTRFPTNSPLSSAARTRRGVAETSIAEASLFFLYFDLRPLICYLQYGILKRPLVDPSIPSWSYFSLQMATLYKVNVLLLRLFLLEIVRSTNFSAPCAHKSAPTNSQVCAFGEALPHFAHTQFCTKRLRSRG